MSRLDKGVFAPTFQIAVEFPSNSAFTLQRLHKAEELLHLELQSGLLCGHEAAGSAARLLVTTSHPDECAAEISDRVGPIGGSCHLEITLVPHGE